MSMKQLLLAGPALLALLSSHPSAEAAPVVFDFTFTGSIVDFAVPTTDTYQILAFGAQGGDSAFGGTGGRGAEIGGDFSLTAGDALQIAVGGAGMSSNECPRIWLRSCMRTSCPGAASLSVSDAGSQRTRIGDGLTTRRTTGGICGEPRSRIRTQRSKTLGSARR